MFVMKIDGMAKLSNILGGTSHTIIGISNTYDISININANQHFFIPLTPGKKRSLKVVLGKISRDKNAFNEFYGELIRRIFYASK